MYEFAWHASATTRRKVEIVGVAMPTWRHAARQVEPVQPRVQLVPTGNVPTLVLPGILGFAASQGT